MIGMKLAGEKALQSLLKQLAPKIARKVTRQAMSKAADPIVKAGRQAAKQLGSRRVAKGRTRKGVYHIEMRASHQLARSIGKRMRSYTKQGVVYVAVGPRWPQGAHGHLVEFGHRVAVHRTGTLHRVQKPGARRKLDPISKVTGERGRGKVLKFVPPHPFLRPAFHSQRHAALSVAEKEHRARIEKEARIAAKEAGFIKGALMRAQIFIVSKA